MPSAALSHLLLKTLFFHELLFFGVAVTCGLKHPNQCPGAAKEDWNVFEPE